MTGSKRLVIVGDRAFAEIAYEYFTHDSEYEVAAFSVEKEFISCGELFGLPVVPFELLESSYPPDENCVFVALTYAKLNRVRTRLLAEARTKGFKPVSYVSSRAFVWPNVELGENCFVFENNVVQPFVKIGDNCILWSGNHIGHHSVIGSNCFISSHVVISGFSKVGDNCFFGVNSTVAEGLEIAPDCVVGAGALVLRDTEANKVYRGNPATHGPKSAAESFGLVEAG